MSANFNSQEFDCHGKGCCSETSIEHELVRILQIIRDHFEKPVKVNCGYRCPRHNSEVGGASKTSQHMNGKAADIVIPTVHPLSIARFVESIPGFAGHIGCYTWNDRGDGFVHVDVRGKNSRGMYTENNVNYDRITDFAQTVRRRSKGRVVKVVQKKLASCGLYISDIDGVAGPCTVDGIKEWNKQHGRNSEEWDKKCWDEAFHF